jgi:predicted nuclease with RNAse H fold
VLTLGVDLASAAERTACCLLESDASGSRIVALTQPSDDTTILGLAQDAAAIAIDAPLGWPVAFIEAVSAHATGSAWPSESMLDLRFRATDLHVQRVTGAWPLSVSSDLIGVVAFRAARLLGQLRPLDPARDGSSGVVEVYPAAALRRWGLPSRSYKLPASIAARGAILEGLSSRTRLDVGPFVSEVVATSDRLDALIASLIAFEFLSGRVDPIPEDHTDAARVEGWIHLPSITEAG